MIKGDVTALARLLNLASSSIYRIVQDGVISGPEDGKYDLLKCAHQYITYLQGRAVARNTSFSEEKTRLSRAQAERVEIENEVSKGALIRAEDVMADLAAIFTRFRIKSQAIPRRVAPLVANSTEVQAVEIISDAISDALTELHSEFADPVQIQPSIEGDQAKGQIEGVRMGTTTFESFA